MGLGLGLRLGLGLGLGLGSGLGFEEGACRPVAGGGGDLAVNVLPVDHLGLGLGSRVLGLGVRERASGQHQGAGSVRVRVRVGARVRARVGVTVRARVGVWLTSFPDPNTAYSKRKVAGCSKPVSRASANLATSSSATYSLQATSDAFRGDVR